MTAFTNFAENLVLNWVFTAGAATRPTTWFTALHTANPGETGATGELGAGIGYSRQATTFTTSTAGLTDNSATLTFGPNTATNWGSVSHISVWDNATAGNCLAYGALSSAVTINVGDSLVISAGALDISLD